MDVENFKSNPEAIEPHDEEFNYYSKRRLI
jgi:hypothetical protein